MTEGEGRAIVEQATGLARLVLLDGNAVLTDRKFDAVRLLFFVIDVGAKRDNGDDQCADDEIKTIAAIHEFPLA